MNRYAIVFLLAMSATIVACGGGGGSSSATSAGTSDGGTSAGGTTGGGQSAGATTGDATAGDTGGGAGMLTDIVGVWDMSSTGDQAREEYWDIQADGSFNAYIYRDFKRLYLPLEMDDLEVIRCFENQINTISSAGNGVFTVDGIFADERYGANSYEFKLNPDGTLQAKYPGDLLSCSNAGCSSEQIDRSFPSVSSEFSTSDLFLCPSVIASFESLITAESTDENTEHWDCSFVNVDDRAAEAATAKITIGADGQGFVTVGELGREFSWYSRRGSDLGADYIDGSGGFSLDNLIFYTVNTPDDRFTALDTSLRVPFGEAPVTTYFETDCYKQTGPL